MSFQSLLASWTAPTAAPPSSNVPAPINTGLGFQEKLGSFDVALNFGAGKDLTVGEDFILGGTMTSGIVPWARLSGHPSISVGTGISGGGLLDTSRTLSLDTTYTDNRYVNSAGDTMTGDLWFNGGTRYIGTSDNNQLTIRTNNTDRLTVLANGNVGIGTTNPSSGLKLHVEGKVGATEYCDQNGNNCKAVTAMGGGIEVQIVTGQPIDFVKSVARAWCGNGWKILGGGGGCVAAPDTSATWSSNHAPVTSAPFENNWNAEEGRFADGWVYACRQNYGEWIVHATAYAVCGK